MKTTTSERIKEGMLVRNMKQVDIVNKTGISKGALSSYISGKYIPKQNNIYLIAKALNVSESWLMGYDVPMEKNNSSQDFQPELNKKDKKEIDDYIEEMREELMNSNSLLFDGEPADEEDIEAILNAMKVGAELVKKKNKEKYTPKKYRK